MNRLSSIQRERVIAALVEGNSIRATVRMTGASKNAIQRLLAAIGPESRTTQFALQEDSMRRDLVLLLREAKERPEREAGAVRLWRRLDMDGALCRYQADLLLEDWHARRFHGLCPHARSGGTP